ncbi:TonB-dependent receptor [Bacteroides caecicola]|uniref:TonB-dependent receptor n=1 Tax=Bacteroides caecicola TaxID=1462569 RepID=A0ABS2FC97_9BACE|nr:TonB-dependent receptor [Bacteroides caecicola]MBM6807374.1 TonB-dependent receptor [Bacteroides caecicola]
MTFPCSSAETLVISFIGLESQEVKIQPVVKVVLHSDSEVLDEVIVTGYGTFKKSSFTGAASTMSPDKLKDVPTVSMEDKLAGSIPGVQISSFSGAPGATTSIRIRGMGSMNAGNDPLYVIDGTPMLSGNISGFNDPATGGGYNSTGTNILSTLNSNDIESITVIKDAAAASLYGSRAANGVIVITTKKGAAGKTQFNFRSDWGFSNMAINYRPVLDGDARRELIKTGLKNYAIDEMGESEAGALAYAEDNIDKYAAKPANGWTNWKDILFKNGSHQNYEINAQGGNEKTKFYSSLAYTKQEGITMNAGLERFTGTANVTHESGRIRLEASTLFSRVNQDQETEGAAFASPIMSYAWTASPSMTVYDEEGNFSTNFPLTNGANPVQSATYNYDRSKITRSFNTIAATWTIWDALKLREKISFDYTNIIQDVWWDPRSNDGRSSNGVMQRYTGYNETLNTQTQLTYVKTFAQKHNLDVLLGFETEDYKTGYTYASGQQFPGLLNELINAGETSAETYAQSSRLTSYLGRIDYNFDHRYYIGGSFRRDGSSRLAKDNRWGNFWSVSGSWRFMQESFMESLRDVITDGKLRVSYGVNGTQPSDYYAYMNLYKYGQKYNNQSGMGIIGVGNPNLKWEKNKAFNIGLDLTLFERLSLTLDYYNRTTSDLLMNMPISFVPGYYEDTNYSAAMLQNIGSLRNSGVEFSISSTNIQTKDFMWTTSLNLGHNKNKVVKLDGVQTETIDAVNPVLIHRVGEPYYSYYMYEYAGVDPQTGNEMYYKNDGTNETTTNVAEAKQVIVAHHDPKVEGGLTNYLKWKFIDFNLTLTYSIGGNAYDYATWLHDNGGSNTSQGSIPDYYKLEDMWQQPGDNAKLPKFKYGNTRVNSSRWLMPTDYLRVKNLSLGFNVPENYLTKLGFNKARIYFSASNLLTWKSKDLYVDPEMPVDGLCTFETPALRTYTFGIEIGF